MQANHVQMAHFKVKPEKVEEFEEAAQRLFAAIQEKLPKGMRYTMCRLYVGLLELESGMDNPLPALPEGKKFLERIGSWAIEAPIREQMTVIGSYRLS